MSDQKPIGYAVVTGKGFLQSRVYPGRDYAIAQCQRAHAGARVVALFALEGDSQKKIDPRHPFGRIADAVRELKNGINSTHGLPQWCHDAVDKLIEGL